MITKLTSSFRLIRFFNSLSSSSSIVFCETLDFGVRKKTSMAEEVAENVKAVPVSEDELYGFKRSEMYSGTLAGSVGPYGRHVFLCYKSHETWLPRVETEGLPQRFAKSFKDRKADFGVETKLTVCGGGESDGDVLIFPEMVRYKAIQDTDVDAFVEDVLVKGKPWTSGVQEELSGSFVFVCAHGSRDKRCGVCGPVLMEKFLQEIGSRGLSEKIVVLPCSHIGGHKYAGNLIVFSPDSAGNVSGHWYGYVTPDDVPAMLDQHIGKGEIIQNLSRGGMRLRPIGEEAEKEDEHKIPNGNSVVVEAREPVDQKGFTGGCCQGANGVSCCQEQAPEPVKKEGSMKLNWLRSMGKEEVLLGAAAVSAIATIAVAYSIYRRSG
ncbi:Thioredoxin-like superfamily [Arabidopsis suecica]|uniref:Thioredoxin-like superfamily n=1 Tax=Arabidopsis suecica TaxID=45249 RepID=A0A8T1ZSJ8_ARASU|nr:Thioredoxin-like superfamily [Arabidopsis suecica]